jgi:hypothetical protein
MAHPGCPGPAFFKLEDIGFRVEKQRSDLTGLSDAKRRPMQAHCGSCSSTAVGTTERGVGIDPAPRGDVSNSLPGMAKPYAMLDSHTKKVLPSNIGVNAKLSAVPSQWIVRSNAYLPRGSGPSARH